MLIEIKIGSAKFIENNMGIPQEIKKNNYHVIQQSHFWVYIQRKLNQYLKDISMSLVHCHVSWKSQDKETRKQPKCPLMDE